MTQAMQIMLNRIWSVRLPVVVREMATKYVDEFFADGSLRLSSFATFAKHEDEEGRPRGTALRTKDDCGHCLRRRRPTKPNTASPPIISA